MSTWKPPLWPGVHIGVAGLCVLLATEGYILWNFFGRGYDLGSFLLALAALLALALLVAVGYLLYALMKLGYSLDDGALTITWGLVRHVLPLSTIDDVSTTYAPKQGAYILAMPWHGYYVGRGTGSESGNVLFFATSRSPEQTAFIFTPEAIYAISPRDRDTFVETLRRKILDRGTYEKGESARTATLGPKVLFLPFWQDRVCQALLLTALLGNLAIFAHVSFRFPFLPPVLPLHYNLLGEIDFLGTRWEAFKIPGIGSAVLLANFAIVLLLHSKERLASMLLLVTATLVQVVLLVATVKILP